MGTSDHYLNADKWAAPADMTVGDIELCMAGKMCGAPLRKPATDGRTYCTRRPMAGQSGPYPHFCRLHAAGRGEISTTGGSTDGTGDDYCGNAPKNPGAGAADSTGIDVVADNDAHRTSRSKRKKLAGGAGTTGIYSSGILPDEFDVYDKLPIGSLEEEIRITRLRLRRALIAEKRQAQVLASGDTAAIAELYITVRRSEKNVSGTQVESHCERMLPDYSKIIDRLTGRIARLEQQSYTITGKADNTPEKQAEIARKLLSEFFRD